MYTQYIHVTHCDCDALCNVCICVCVLKHFYSNWLPGFVRTGTNAEASTVAPSFFLQPVIPPNLCKNTCGGTYPSSANFLPAVRKMLFARIAVMLVVVEEREDERCFLRMHRFYSFSLYMTHIVVFRFDFSIRHKKGQQNLMRQHHHYHH